MGFDRIDADKSAISMRVVDVYMARYRRANDSSEQRIDRPVQ